MLVVSSPSHLPPPEAKNTRKGIRFHWTAGFYQIKRIRQAIVSIDRYSWDVPSGCPVDGFPEPIVSTSLYQTPAEDAPEVLDVEE